MSEYDTPLDRVVDIWCDRRKDYTGSDGKCFCNDVYVEVPR